MLWSDDAPLTITDESGNVTTFAYQEHYQESLLTLDGSDTETVASYENDDVGRLTSRSRANGVVTTCTYDAVDHVTSNVVTKSGSTPVVLWSNSCGCDGRSQAYSPELGGFLQSDPIDFAGGVKAYSYVGNNPMIWIDPDGRNPAAALRGLRGGA